jgi:nicotinamidase-related amidase
MSNPKSAILVMDMQTSILGILPDSSDLKNKTAQAIAHARVLNIPVIYVTVGFRKGAPEVSDFNKGFSAGRARFASSDATEFLKVDPSLAPKEDEIRVVKRRVSAFTGSDLEVVLRAKDIRHLILCGIATSGVVLSTLREAADKDFQISVISDCCADMDEEVHRVLLRKIFPRQAEVLSLEQWMKA